MARLLAPSRSLPRWGMLGCMLSLVMVEPRTRPRFVEYQVHYPTTWKKNSTMSEDEVH